MLLMMTATSGIQAQQYHDNLLQNVKGKVKYIVYARGSKSEVVNFTQDGKILKNDISHPTYNKDGYMTKCQFLLYGNYCDMTYEYKDGKLTKERLQTKSGCSITEYSYHDDGTASQEVHTIIKNGLSSSYTFAFQYVYFDEHGNWTKCIVSCNGKSFAESRAILYWE